MKKILSILTFFMLAISVNATTYYVATTGSDSNPGTLAQPFATWEKLSTVMVAGDIAYIRGGTYRTTKAVSASVHCMFEDLNGTSTDSISIRAYPGEFPVLNLDNFTPLGYSDPIGVYLLNSEYVHIKGLRVTGLKQINDGSGISRGFNLWNSNHCTIEFVEVDNIGGPAFKIETTSNDNLFLNCDAHHVGDGRTDNGADAWDNSDGYSLSGGDLSTRNTFDGCRAWLCCDDGWDFFGTNGSQTLKGCQSFWNGFKPWGTSNDQPGSTMTAGDPSVFYNNASYIAGSGEGYKLGPAASQNLTLLTKTVIGCISFENRGTGYASNSDDALTTRHSFVNCVAYNNGNDGWGYANGGNPGWSTGAAQTFKNCWAWSNNRKNSGGNFAYDGLNGNISNNYWDTYYGAVNYGNLKATIGQLANADFKSVSSVGADGLRQADGSLPKLDFLKPAAGSRLINKGVDVGLPSIGGAPDLGAYEFEYDVTPSPTIKKFVAVLNSGKVNIAWDVLATDPFNSFVVSRNGTGIKSPPAVKSQTSYQTTDSFPITGTNSYQVIGYLPTATVSSSTVAIAYAPVITPTKVQNFALNNVVLTWQADYTANSDHFDVERKTTSVYVKVATVPANKSSRDYSLTTPLATGTNYFRIRPVDKSGAGSYITLPAVKKN